MLHSMAQLAIAAVAGYALMEWCGMLAALVSAAIAVLAARFVIRASRETSPLSAKRGVLSVSAAKATAKVGQERHRSPRGR
jgi:hypothetical protein